MFFHLAAVKGMPPASFASGRPDAQRHASVLEDVLPQHHDVSTTGLLGESNPPSHPTVGCGRGGLMS
jgi:hypothetical protein